MASDFTLDTVRSIGHMSSKVAERTHLAAKQFNVLNGNRENFECLFTCSMISVSLERAALCWQENQHIQAERVWIPLFSDRTVGSLKALLSADQDDLAKVASDVYLHFVELKSRFDDLFAQDEIMNLWPKYNRRGDRI